MWHPSCFSLALPFTLFSPIPPFFSTLPFFCQQFLTDYLLRARLFQVLEITVVGKRDKSYLLLLVVQDQEGEMGWMGECYN